MQTDVLQFRLLPSCVNDMHQQRERFISAIGFFQSAKNFSMKRFRNTDQNGNNWSQELIRAVWNKGQEIPGFDPDKYRKDCCGAWMQFNKFGHISENGVGWEIDHIQPISKGGTDDLSNLQPLQWQNNRSKGEEFPADDYAVIGSF